jgi:hypothetical protein
MRELEFLTRTPEYCQSLFQIVRQKGNPEKIGGGSIVVGVGRLLTEVAPILN